MTLEDLAWAVEDVRLRLAPYALRRAYDEGHHRLLFATEKYRNTFGDLFREFADNLCDDVVDHITDRLQIVGWSADDRGVGVRLAAYWEDNRGDTRIGAVHRNAFREGDGFTIVQRDPQGRARVWKQRPEQMAVRYSTEFPDQIEVAAKVWRQGKRYRANLYYPDGLTEKYATKGIGNDGTLPRVAAFVPLAAGDPDLLDAQTYQVAGVIEGMPVFHFPNGEVSEYGRSILDPVIPLQDALNKAVADMLVAMEFHAYPQRYATGVQVEYQPDGSERNPFAAGEGRVWRVTSKDASFGQFDPAAMEGFLDVQDSFRLEIARKGKMPPHSISLRSASAAAPSGVSLLVAEGSAIKLAKDRQRDWGWTHRAQAAYALNLEVQGLGVTAGDLEPQWAPPETRDMKALLEELALKRDLGVPTEQVLKEAGYDEDQVREFLDQAEAEAEEQAVAMTVLQGGRVGGTVGQARTLNGRLGVPSGPVPPNGGQTDLAQA